MGWQAVILGVIMFLGPSVIVWRELGGTIQDLILWMTRQPLSRLFVMRGSTWSGLSLIMAGLAMVGAGL